jgi:hypothetical protein
MTANKTHSPDKHVLQQKIEAIRQLADKSAHTGDFDELLRYFPHPWFTRSPSRLSWLGRRGRGIG